MTLEVAVAKYLIERDAVLDELHPFAADYPDTSISWHRERDKRALDAAVKDAMLATIDEVRACGPVDAQVQLERLFEGGTE